MLVKCIFLYLILVVHAGGHIKPDPYWHASQVASEYGVIAGAELAAFETANLYALKKYVEREKVDCDMVVTRACDVHFTKAQHKKAQEGLQKMQKLGVSAANDAFELGEKNATMVLTQEDSIRHVDN